LFSFYLYQKDERALREKLKKSKIAVCLRNSDKFISNAFHHHPFPFILLSRQSLGRVYKAESRLPFKASSQGSCGKQSGAGTRVSLSRYGLVFPRQCHSDRVPHSFTLILPLLEEKADLAWKAPKKCSFPYRTVLDRNVLSYS
jgi:hypothetical protein